MDSKLIGVSNAILKILKFFLKIEKISKKVEKILKNSKNYKKRKFFIEGETIGIPGRPRGGRPGMPPKIRDTFVKHMLFWRRRQTDITT